MSEVTKNAQMMSDEALGEVAGGMSRDLIAAYDVMAGKSFPISYMLVLPPLVSM